MKKLLSLVTALILTLASPLTALAAISGTNLTTGTDIDGNSTATTASISPSSNQLILLSVTARTNISVDTNQPTVTGDGVTWVLVNDILYDTTSASRKRLSVFRALGTPTSGALTIDYGGQNQTNIAWTVSQFSGIDTSGTNGSGAIVQSITAKDESVTTGTLTVTLGAFSSVNNATFGAFAADNTSANVFTPGSGFATLGTINTATGGSDIEIGDEFKNSNDTSVDSTWSINAMLGGVAVELAAASTASPDAAFTIKSSGNLTIKSSGNLTIK